MKSDHLYIFPFIKYIKPGWYFNLFSDDIRYPLWIDYDKADEKLKALIEFDESYSSREASLRDAAYQFLQKGVISSDTSLRLSFSDDPALKDNYRFIRKYFNATWIYFILFVRLLSFKNIFKEIKAYKKGADKERINVYKQHYEYEDYKRYNSELLNAMPKVSVVIPTLNRYKYLHDVMSDLEKQDYKNFEVIVCDQTDEVDHEFYKKYDLDIKLIVQEEKALWLARNRSIKESKGEYILLFDDDSRVEKDWISQHLKCINFFKCDISSGVSLSTSGARIPENYSFFCRSDQLDTGNVMIRKEIFKKTGLFDRQFEKQRMGDGEFGLRCYLAGIENISNPYAKRVHLKVSTGGLRQMGSWDAFRTKKLLSPRPIPSVLYLSRKYFGNKTARLLLMISLPPSILPYKHKGNRMLGYLSYLMFVFIAPLVLLQVMISWNRSTKMLKEGDKIEWI